jgi:hypothetical protein
MSSIFTSFYVDVLFYGRQVGNFLFYFDGNVVTPHKMAQDGQVPR